MLMTVWPVDSLSGGGMEAMDHRDGLSPAQRAYAKAFYPVFEGTKVVLLRVAASMILWTQGSASTEDLVDALRLSLDEMRRIQDTWTAFVSAYERRYGPDDHAVTGEITVVTSTVAALRHVVDGASHGSHEDKERAHALMGRLAACHGALRRSALALWPLELMAETCV